MEERSDFYVYVHTRATDGSVFYVGKGHSKRAWFKKGRSEYWNNIVAKHDYNVTILLNNLTEEQAFILEKQTIATHGRESLCNLTDGGEGFSGLVYTQEHKQKLREANIGSKHSLETKRKMSEARKGKIKSEETKRKMSESKKGKPAWNKGIKRSEEHKRKISEAKKGKKKSPESIAKRTATRAANRLLKQSQ